jgi:hypothetical protein
MLERFGTDEQKACHLDEFVSDHRFVTSFAVTEPHFGSDKVPSSPSPEPTHQYRGHWECPSSSFPGTPQG